MKERRGERETYRIHFASLILCTLMVTTETSGHRATRSSKTLKCLHKILSKNKREMKNETSKRNERRRRIILVLDNSCKCKETCISPCYTDQSHMGGECLIH